LNQKKTSACTGFGLARTIDLLLMRAKRPRKRRFRRSC
jgi:hypothetical protein